MDLQLYLQFIKKNIFRSM